MRKIKTKRHKSIIGKSNIKEPKMDAPEIKGKKISTKDLDDMVMEEL